MAEKKPTAEEQAQQDKNQESKNREAAERSKNPQLPSTPLAPHPEAPSTKLPGGTPGAASLPANTPGGEPTDGKPKEPKVSDEPAPIPMAPGNIDNRAFSLDEPLPTPSNVVFPEPAERTIPNVRTIDAADLASDGYKCLNGGAAGELAHVMLRPGDVVAGAVDVFPIDDVSDEARITLYPGATVPEGARGYLPAHYMLDDRRRAISGESATPQRARR